MSPGVLLEDPFTGIIRGTIAVEIHRGDPDVFVVAAEAADPTEYGAGQFAPIDGSGAALTYEDAHAAAVGECLERWALTVVHPEDIVLASYDELAARGLPATEPGRWALFDPRQLGHVPFSPFAGDTPIGWVWAESLTRRRECLVPACLVYLPYVPARSDRGERIIAPSISTGTACAPSRSEALLKGVLEVVERDAFMIVWRNRLSCPVVEIDRASAIYTPFVERFARPGLEYTLVYTTLDLGIPSFFGVLRDVRGARPRTMIGGAAALDPARAALKTLAELAQSLKWFDHIDETSFPLEDGFTNVRSFDDRALLYAMNDLGQALEFVEDRTSLRLSELPSLALGDRSRELRLCAEALYDRGLEVLGVDVTPTDVLECGFHVVRALVPGLETMEGDHLVPLLGGRRWREVPVELGLRSRPASLDDVNPYPHPYP